MASASGPGMSFKSARISSNGKPVVIINSYYA
jgi:hypothetical protein